MRFQRACPHRPEGKEPRRDCIAPVQPFFTGSGLRARRRVTLAPTAGRALRPERVTVVGGLRVLGDSTRCYASCGLLVGAHAVEATAGIEPASSTHSVGRALLPD